MVLFKSMVRGEPLAADLCLLERDTFDTDKYIRSKCPAMSEKGVKKLRSEMTDLKNALVAFSRADVHAEYKNFIKATRDISGLETSLFKVRNLLSNQVAIIHGLLESTDTGQPVEEDEADNGAEREEAKQPEFVQSEWEKRALALLDKLEILLAERKTEDAVTAITEGEKLLSKHEAEEPNADSLRVMLSSMKDRLVEALMEATRKPSVRGAELRAACSVLERLEEGPKAHTLILLSHHTRLLHRMKGLRRSGSSYGGAYTAALSQLTFSAIARALKDSVAVFGAPSSYGSELVVWARQVVAKFVVMLKKYVLSSAAAAGGLRAAGECVLIALGHCALLEKDGLALCPLLSTLLKPSIVQAVSANLKRIGESTLALAAADNWSIADPYPEPRTGRRPSRSADGVQLRLTSSALKFNVMIEDFLGGLEPLVNFQLAASVFLSLSQAYEHYVNFLIKALPLVDAMQAAGEERNLKTAETLPQQLALVGNAAALAEEILPGVIRRLAGRQVNYGKAIAGEPMASDEDGKEWRLELGQSVQNLRSMVCKVLLRDIAIDRQGKPLVTPHIYSVNEGEEPWHNEPVPSQVFQALFSKVSTIAKTGEEMLRGQEAICSLLITELLVSVLRSISSDEEFWQEMEEGQSGFTPLGLNMFVLDMQFVVHFASEGHYSTELMYKIVAELIARATNAFALQGGDPMRILPEDQWFVEASQVAFDKLACV